MKKVFFYLTAIALIFSGCKTQQQASSVTNDDVYSSPKYSTQLNRAIHQNTDLSAPQTIATPNSTSTSKNGTASWYDDYNDYSKSVEKQSSTDNNGTSGSNGYVDPSLYDNTYSSTPNVNVYVGSSYDPFFWGSSVSIGFGFGWNSYYWGYPYYSWYYPYYGYYPYPYYGWGGYGNGYWDGYRDGYWDGRNGNPYYNTYSNFYYGQRNMISSSGEGTHRRIPPRQIDPGTGGANKTPSNINPHESRITERTADTRSQDTKRNDRGSASQGSVNPRQRTNDETGQRSVINSTPADRQHYTYGRRGVSPATGTVNENTRVNPRGSDPRERPAPKYSRTDNQGSSGRKMETQNYASPSYRQPKYSQEYINPRAQEARTNGTAGTSSDRRSYPSADNRSQSRTHMTPSSTERRYTPSSSSTGNSPRSYGNSSRSTQNSGYSVPSRSYSAPSSSGARSGGGASYSSPSRSGGSSSPSSGGGGGGGRRK